MRKKLTTSLRGVRTLEMCCAAIPRGITAGREAVYHQVPEAECMYVSNVLQMSSAALTRASGWHLNPTKLPLM